MASAKKQKALVEASKSKPSVPRKQIRYDPEIYPNKAYALANEGKGEEEIIKHFAVTQKTFRAWMNTKPDFKEAVTQGWEKSRPDLLLKDVGGRPEIYRPDVHDRMVKAFALMGFKDETIAKNMGIGNTTYYRWLRQFPGFRQSLDEGKRVADIEIIEAMRMMATGFTHQVKKIKIPRGSDETKAIQVVEEVYIPPNFAAAKHWLAVRHKDIWGGQNESGNADEKHNIIVQDDFTKDDDVCPQSEDGKGQE